MAQWWETPAASLNPPDPVPHPASNGLDDLAPRLPGAQDNPYLRSALSAYQQMRDQSRANLTPAQPAPVAPVEPPKPEEGKLNLLGGLADVGRLLYDIPTQTRAAWAGMREGGEDPYAVIDEKDAAIQAGKQRLIERQTALGASANERILPFLPLTRSDVVDTSGSTGFSLVGAGTGLAAGVPSAIAGNLAAPVVGTVAGLAAGGAASGKAAFNMAQNAFLREGYDALSAKKGSPLTPEEWQAALPKLQEEAVKAGLWEAIPEAASNMVMAGVGGKLLKNWGKEGVKKVIAGVGSLYGTELATETATQVGQHNAAVRAGIGEGPERSFSSPQDLWTSLKEVAPQVFILTSLMGGAGAAGGALYHRGQQQQQARAAGQDATQRADLARLALAHLDEPRLVAAAEQARQALADNPKMPPRQRQALEATLGHLDADLQGRANGEGLRQALADPAQLQTLRGQATLAGMADDARVGQLSDEELLTAAEQAVQMAQTPALGQGLQQQFTEVAQAYTGHLKARQQLANLDAALQADPTIAPSLAARITQAATGQPKKGITPEYSRASLDDTELTRHLTAAERLLGQHGGRLNEDQRASLTEARAALQAERDQRTANPDWPTRNAQIIQANDPREVRLRQAFAKNPEKTVARLTANDAPVIDALIQSFETRVQTYAQTGYPAPESLTRPLTLLQARKAALDTEATQQQQAAEQKRQADYRQQQQSPVPTLAGALDLAPPTADPLGDWLSQRATIADEQGQSLKRAIAALQGASGPQATPEQQRRAEEGRRLIAARLEGELLQQGIEEQAARAQAQAAVDDWIGSGARPRASGVIGQMGQPLGNPAPAQGRQELNRLLGPDTSPAPVPTATPGAPRSLIDLLQRPSTAHAVPTAPARTEGALPSGSTELDRLLGPAPAPQAAPATPISQPQSLADFLNRDSTAGNVPSAPGRAEGPMAAPAPRARPKRTQAEIKAQQGKSAVPTPAQGQTDFPPIAELAQLSESELDALQQRFSAWMDQHGDENSWVQMPDGSRAETILSVRSLQSVKDYQRALEAAQIQAYRNRPARPNPPSRPADPRMAAQQQQFEKKLKDREAQIDALRQPIQARLAAIRQQAKARKAAGEDPQTIIKELSPLLREGQQHLDWLEQRAFEATDGKGRSVNPRASGAQWTAIPESLRAFAENTPAPVSAPQSQPQEAPREKGYAKTQTVLKAVPAPEAPALSATPSAESALNQEHSPQPQQTRTANPAAPPNKTAPAQQRNARQTTAAQAKPAKKPAKKPKPPTAAPPTAAVHTTPEGETEAVTPAVVNEALQESIPNRVSAQEKAKTIAGHIGDVLQQIDAAIKTAFEHGGALHESLGKSEAKDALEHQRRQLVRKAKAAQGHIVDRLVAGLQELHKHYSSRLSSEQQTAKSNKRPVDADTQDQFNAVDRLYQQAKAARTDAKRWALYQQNATEINKLLSIPGYSSSYIGEPLRSAIKDWEGTQNGLQQIEKQLPTASDTKTIVTIDVPGDGRFTVPNTVPALKELRTKIEKSALFKKGALPDGRSKPQAFNAKSTPASAALLAMTREKDGSHAENVANAWNLALAREVEVLISPTGKSAFSFAGTEWKNHLTQNTPILYVDQRPVDTSRYPALSSIGPIVVAQASTLSGTRWDVLQGETGVTLAMSGKTPESAIANLEDKLKGKSADQVQAAFNKKLDELAEGLGVQATGPAVKAGLEARMAEWVEQVQNPAPSLPDAMDQGAPQQAATAAPSPPPLAYAYAAANELRQARKAGQIDTSTLIQRLAQQVVSGEIPIGKLFGNLQAFDDWNEGQVAAALQQAGASPKMLKDLGYEQQFAAVSTPSAVTDSLKTLAGNALVQDLIDGGTLRVVARQAQLPASIVIPAGQRVAGAVDPQTGVVYLIAENIAPDEIAGFLTHEVGVHQAQLGLNQPKSRALRLAHALARLVGARQILGEPTFNDVLTQLQRLRAISKPVQAAYAAAQRAMGSLNQSPELLHEEALAYLVQNHPQTSLAQKILAAVRAFLYKAGLRMNLTENDLQALAVSALRSAARGNTRPGTVSKGVMGRNPQDVEAQRQYDAVVARYTNPDGSKKDGWLKAPNGQPTKLPERQWVQVQTENFKKWFDGSKVIDENGEPRIVWRGDGRILKNKQVVGFKSPYFIFDQDYINEGQAGFHFGTLRAAVEKIYDTHESINNEPIEKIKKLAKPLIAKGMLRPFFLNLRNPLLTSDGLPVNEEIAHKPIPAGYDGTIYINDIEDAGKPSFIVTSPTQIKSALGNTGAFSPDNADIRFAYALGQAEPNLTAEEVLQRIEAGGEVTAEEFALLQAYLSGASRALTATGIDAPTFKTWFGASKIKGKTGQPLKMYHGTMTDFTVFDAGQAGTITTHPTATLGFFFTNDRAHAATKYGDRVMEVYLAIEKPYVMTDADLRRIESREEALAFRQRLERQGYDGLVLPAETKTRYVVAFRPDQIKRTTNETYTRGENDIRFAKKATHAALPALPETISWNEVIDFSSDDRFKHLFSSRPSLPEIKAFQAWLKSHPDARVRLYHGTAALNPVQSAGLLKTTASRRNSLQSASGYVYLSVYPGHAKDFARFAGANRGVDAEGYRHALYSTEVRVAELFPDADQLKNQRFSNPEIGNSLAESLVFGHGARIKGNLPANRVQLDQRFALANPAPGTPPQLMPPPMTRVDVMQRAIQDKFQRFKTIQSWIKSLGINLTPDADVYGAEERSVKRFAARAEDFRNDILKPLVQEAAKAKYRVTGGDLIAALMEKQPLPATFKPSIPEFLIAQHARERNARIAKINPAYPDSGSGLTNAQAADILTRYRALPDFAAFSALAEKFRAISEGTKTLMHQAGLLSDEMVRAWNAAYQYYIPLKGGPEEGAQAGTGQGQSVNAKQHRAMGHGLRDENVLENIFRDRERALLLIEKNEVGKAMRNLLNQANNPEIGTVGQPEKQAVMAQGWYHEVWIGGRPLGAFQSYTTAKAAIAADSAATGRPVARYGVRHKAADPGVVYMTRSQLAENEATVYINGERIRMQLNDEGAARAYNALGMDGATGVIKVGQQFNRFLSKAYTGWNPEFLAVNIARDFTSGLINLTGKHGIGFAGKAAANYPAAFADALRYAWDSSRQGNHPWIDRYRAAGGSTGAAYLSDLERIGEDVTHTFQDAQGAIETWKSGKPGAALRVASTDLAQRVFGWLEKMNMAGENAMRLATFRTVIEAGGSDAEAASAAANVTVNFNRRGEIGQQLSALYLFFNPNVQGTQVLLDTLINSPHKAQAWALAGSLAGLALLLAGMARSGGDDEEKKWRTIPGYVKDRNMILRVGDKQLLIPVPFGYGAFWALGNVLSDKLHGADDGKAGIRLASALFQHFSPLGNPLAGDEADIKNLVGMMPTLTRIPLELAVNRNALGSPIMPELQSWNAGQPDSQRKFRATTGTLFDDLAVGLNRLTGGSAYTSGYVDVSPEAIKKLWRDFSGGAGQFMVDSVNALRTTAQGATPTLREMPIIRKFVREETVQDARSYYQSQAQQVKVAIGALNAAKRAKDAAGMKSVVHEKAELLHLGQVLGKLTKMIQLRRELEQQITASDLPLPEKREQLKRVEAQERRLYDVFDRLFLSSRTQNQQRLARVIM